MRFFTCQIDLLKRWLVSSVKKTERARGTLLELSELAWPFLEGNLATFIKLEASTLPRKHSSPSGLFY